MGFMKSRLIPARIVAIVQTYEALLRDGQRLVRKRFRQDHDARLSLAARWLESFVPLFFQPSHALSQAGG